MTMTVDRLTPTGASSTWGRPMPEWYWRLRSRRVSLVHFGWRGPSPVEFDECPYNRGTGSCSLGCWEEPVRHTCAPGRYGWPSRPLNLHRISDRIRGNR